MKNNNKFTLRKIDGKYHVIVWKGDKAVAAYTCQSMADVNALKDHHHYVAT